MHRASDKVKIRSKEWIDSQNKDNFNAFMAGPVAMIGPQFKYAGMDAIITKINGNVILLDVDNGKWMWSEEMLEEEING